MVTGFDYLSKDKVLQEHWFRRFVAIVLDAVIIYLPMWLLFTLLGYPYFYPGLLSGVLLFLYCALLDTAIGGTVGKLILHLKAVPTSGKMSFPQALMRDVSKIFVVFLLLDWIVGMAVDTNDPRQKWTDQIARTSVIVYDHPGGT
jgi:uncharacterized RDD family membrane protein YckC